MSTWAVRITLPLGTDILTPARVAPWYRKHTHIEFNGSVFDYQEHWLMLHSGITDSYPWGEENADQNTWYAGYLPGGGAPVLSANVDIVDGGDFEQLSEIRFLVANQMADGTLMSDWLKSQYGEHLMSGAVCEVYLDLPSEVTPAPVARWTGNVRSATPVGVNLELVCESIALANEIGDDIGGGIIRPIVYGQAHKIKLPKVRQTEFAPWPLNGSAPGFWPRISRKQTLEVAAVSPIWVNYPADASPAIGRVGPLYIVRSTGKRYTYNGSSYTEVTVSDESLLADYTWVELNTFEESYLLTHIPGGAITTSDWYVEIAAGKGKGLVRRIPKGTTLQWLPGDVYGTPIYNTPGRKYGRWRIPIEEEFWELGGESLVQVVEGSTYQERQTRSTARLVQRSSEYAVPASLTAQQVVDGTYDTFVQINGEYVVARSSEPQWELGADASSVRAVGLSADPTKWELIQHVPLASGEYEFWANTSYADVTIQQPAAQALVERMDDDVPGLDSIADLATQTIYGYDFGIGISAMHFPWKLGIHKVYGCAYVETEAQEDWSSVSVNVMAMRLTTSGENSFSMVDLVAPSKWAGTKAAQLNTFPPFTGAYPGSVGWQKRAATIFDLEEFREGIDSIMIWVRGGGHRLPNETTVYWPVMIGQMSFFAAFYASISDAWVSAPGPTPASGSEELVAKWTDRLALVESDEFPAGTEIIADHAHLIEDVAYRYLVGSVDAAAIEQAYQDREAKTMTSLVAPSTGRPRAELSLTKSAQVGDVYAQVCRDGMFVGALNGTGAITLKAWLARTGLAEADGTILVATEADPDVFDGFTSTGVDKVITAPLIRYAVEGDTPSKAIQILRPDAPEFDESYTVGFESIAHAEIAWQLCHECYKATQLVHVREMVFSTVGDYASLMRLILQERGTPFLRWIGLPKDTAPLLISADHPAAHLPLGSRVLLVDPRHCPSGRYGTISSRKIDLNAWKCSLTLLMDLPT